MEPSGRPGPFDGSELGCCPPTVASSLGRGSAAAEGLAAAVTLSLGMPVATPRGGMLLASCGGASEVVAQEGDGEPAPRSGGSSGSSSRLLAVCAAPGAASGSCAAAAEGASNVSTVLVG